MTDKPKKIKEWVTSEKQQLFAVKKDGLLQTKGGLCGNKSVLMAFWLHRNHNVIGCDDPDCDCDCDPLDQLWADHADGATIVPVTIVELENKGAWH